MLSPGQEPRLAGFPRSGVRRASRLPSAPPQTGERAPPRANGEVLGPEQRMRPTESPRRAGPAPGGPRQKPGRGASPEVPGSARGQGGPPAARPRRGPLAPRALRADPGAPPSRKCRGGKRRAHFFAWFRAGRCLVGRERVRGATPALTVRLRRGFKPLASSEGGDLLRAAGGPLGAGSGRGCPRGRRGREGHPSPLPPGSLVAAQRAPTPTPRWPAGAQGPRLAAPGPGGSRSGKVHRQGNSEELGASR